MPPTMDFGCSHVPPRDGHHCNEEIRSSFIQQEFSSKCVRGASAKSKAKAEVPEEAQGERRRLRRDEIGTLDRSCGAGKGPFADGSSCSSTSAGPSSSLLGSFDSSDGNLGSGVSPCKVAFSQCGVDPLPTWSSLQTHSFTSWCSSLFRKALRSGTAFGAFLLKTSHVVRGGCPASAKAMFPLPVPKPGIFWTSLCGLSSSKRRKLLLDQAFHVVVMALNFLHADCQFVDLKLLGRPLNAAQTTAVDNLRRIFLAFGRSAGEISVPASGRRSTSLVSLLSDLSEFLTRQGTAESPYHRGFAGAAEDEAATSLGGGGMASRSKERDVDLDGAAVPVDDSRAPELLPYRDLDPSRLALSGKGQWDPSDYLGDTFWLPFKEPSCLLWTSDFDLTDVPDLSREDPDKVLALAKLWDVNGLLHLTRRPVKANVVPSCLRVFNCYKSEQVDRQIGDRRGRNQIEAYLPGPSRALPSGFHLGVLEVRPGSETVIACISDRRDFYHQIQVTPQRAASNVMWPPLPEESLLSTNAYAKLVAQDSLKKSRTPRYLRGDEFGKGPPEVGSGPEEEFGRCGSLFACFGSVIQGDHLGVEIATQGHRGLLADFQLLSKEEEITSCRPFFGDRALQGLVIDDFFSLSVESLRDQRAGVTSTAKKRFDRAQEAYTSAGLGRGQFGEGEGCWRRD